MSQSMTSFFLDVIRFRYCLLTKPPNNKADDAIWLLLPSAAAKFVDLLDGKVEGFRPDNKIQSLRSPRSAPIDEG
jgi:hypothetical protein